MRLPPKGAWVLGEFRHRVKGTSHVVVCYRDVQNHLIAVNNMQRVRVAVLSFRGWRELSANWPRIHMQFPFTLEQP